MPLSVPSWGLVAFFAGVWEKNLLLFCASAAASFGIERERVKERENHFFGVPFICRRLKTGVFRKAF